MHIRLTLAAAVAAIALGGCSRQAPSDQNVAIDINDADPADIEAVPTDETSAAESNAGLNASTNAN